MSYNPGVPTANQTFKETQGPINTNFTIANTAFGVDHVNFATNANQGMHNKVTLVTTTDPAAVVQGPIVYSKSIGGKQEIFFRQSTTDGSSIVQLTDMANAVTGGTSNGSTFIPGGIIIKWGQFTTAANPHTVTYTALVPAISAFPTNTLMVQLTPINTGGVGNYRVSTANATTFVVNAPTGSSFYFLAIGN